MTIYCVFRPIGIAHRARSVYTIAVMLSLKIVGPHSLRWAGETGNVTDTAAYTITVLHS